MREKLLSRVSAVFSTTHITHTPVAICVSVTRLKISSRSLASKDRIHTINLIITIDFSSMVGSSTHLSVCNTVRNAGNCTVIISEFAAPF